MIEYIKDKIEEATGLNAYPFLSDASGECVVYSVEPQTDDGAKRTHRLTVRVIADNYAFALEYNDLIRKALLTVGDRPNGELLECHINGGGSLKDDSTKTVHLINYYYMTTKSEVL